MNWHAKPAGAYSFGSIEGLENIQAINEMLSNRSYTFEAQGGMIGNMYAESGLNPWRWQGDTYNLKGGYGLFQFTPATSYLNNAKDIAGYAPNYSTTGQTEGASPSDGASQIISFDRNKPAKWVGYCWRTYWDKTTYADLYVESRRIVKQYGNGSTVSLSQFKQINNLWDATFTFLACFEGPAVPNMDVRYKYAEDAYKIITGGLPPSPPSPPSPSYGGKMKLWLYLKQL